MAMCAIGHPFAGAGFSAALRFRMARFENMTRARSGTGQKKSILLKWLRRKEATALSLAHPNFHLPELGANPPINGLLTEFVQVGILGQPAKIAVTEIDRFVERFGGFEVAFGKAQAASEVVENQRISRTETRELLVDTQPGEKFPPLRVVIAEELQSIHERRVTIDHAL